MKKWVDYGNALETRPTELTVKLYRKANSQPDQDNAIGEQELPEESYALSEPDKDGDIWTYTVTGANGTGLEKFAPNGMPWIYIAKEEVPGNYTGNTSSVQKSADSTQEDKKVNLGQLVNSIQTDVPFSKEWAQQGEDGKTEPITEDYLGFEIAVTFELQVREKNDQNGAWKRAEEFFKDKEILQNYEFTQTKEMSITDSRNGKIHRASAGLERGWKQQRCGTGIPRRGDAGGVWGSDISVRSEDRRWRCLHGRSERALHPAG